MACDLVTASKYCNRITIFDISWYNLYSYYKISGSSTFITLVVGRQVFRYFLTSTYVTLPTEQLVSYTILITRQVFDKKELGTPIQVYFALKGSQIEKLLCFYFLLSILIILKNTTIFIQEITFQKRTCNLFLFAFFNIQNLT